MIDEEDIARKNFIIRSIKIQNMIILNGSVKFRNRRIPIFWTGEFAQHLCEKNNTEPDTHRAKDDQKEDIKKMRRSGNFSS